MKLHRSARDKTTTSTMLCLPGWGGVEREQRFGSFQGQSEGCQNKEGRLSGTDSQRNAQSLEEARREACDEGSSDG